MMGILDCDHADIESFINYKSILNNRNERYVSEFSSSFNKDSDVVTLLKNILTDNQLTHFNISVGITDKFMQAYIDDKDWDLISRVDGSIVKTVKARNLMRLIAESAWRSGDPGVIFLDAMERSNMTPFLGKLRTVNPCFSYHTQILTSSGYKSIGELNNSKVEFINIDGEKSIGNVWFSGQKEAVELRFSNNKCLTCTPNHVFRLVDGSECEAKDSKGKQFHPYLKKPELDNTFSIYGFAQGDGNLTRLNSNFHK